MIFNRKMFYENKEKYPKEYHNVINKTQEEINRLTKKYQENPDTLIKDYDDMLRDYLIGIIANWNTNKFVFSGIIAEVTSLISFRKIIVDYYSNYRSSNNNKEMPK